MSASDEAFFLEEFFGRNQVLGQPTLHPGVPQGDPEELADVQDRDLVACPGLLRDVRLAGIEVCLAHGAKGHHRVGLYQPRHIQELPG